MNLSPRSLKTEVHSNEIMSLFIIMHRGSRRQHTIIKAKKTENKIKIKKTKINLRHSKMYVIISLKVLLMSGQTMPYSAAITII